ncbi:MAG: T9SS type B sorting domain-containing protein [Flavobacteriaceae bacterium]|nr:T9SS type B sorting domain-containing protein [Flavobacteriaceae bacterium]
MQIRYLSSILLLFFHFGYGQEYQVFDYQKINETNGGFLGSLDIADNFGIAIDAIGDLDGNGYVDLAVGAYTDDDGGTNKGAVWILFMEANHRVNRYTKISNTSGGFSGVLDLEDRFGGAVSFLGDLNKDGNIELAVGADYDGDGGYWKGAFWILSLDMTGNVVAYSKISATQGGFSGYINGDAIFGTDIANIGDLDGDGITDLAVGSRRDADGGSRRGAVWILFMNNDLSVNRFQKISETSGNFGAVLEFEDYFGGSVCNIGDLDGDGIVDLAVGAYRDDDMLENSGSVYVLFLNRNGTVKRHQKISNSFGNMDRKLSVDALFGESIDGVLDIDSDGKIELVIGALRQLNPNKNLQTGAFFIVELESDGTVSESYMYTSASLCFGGDLNQGDFFGGAVSVLERGGGNTSIAVGAYKDSENGLEKGAVWILELGERIPSVQIIEHPTFCENNDARIVIDGLRANTPYRILYRVDNLAGSTDLQSDSLGKLEWENLGAGEYAAIEIRDLRSNCIYNLDDLQLISLPLEMQITKTDVSSCGFADGILHFSDLIPNTTYDVSYRVGENLETASYSSTVNGDFQINDLKAGIYDRILLRIQGSNCETQEVMVQIDQPPMEISLQKQHPSDCDTKDGTILIKGLGPLQNYTVSYSFDGNNNALDLSSNPAGEIRLEGLGSGQYENLVVSDTANSCNASTNNIVLNCVKLASLCFRIPRFFSPNFDGINDYWELEVLDACQYTVVITDRYGKLLKVLSPLDSKWDGTFNGNPMPSSDYWVAIHFEDQGGRGVYQTNITLKR